MIEAKISKYYDNEFLSVDLEFEGVVFANVNVESKKLKIDIYKTSKNIALDFDQLFSLLIYSKDELMKTYPLPPPVSPTSGV